MKILFFLTGISFCLWQTNANAQQRFDLEKLMNPQKYGEEVAALLQTEEIYEYKDTIPATFFLQNGFRSSNFVNAEQWLSVRDTVEVYRIDIVYSKYPLRKGTYHEIYPLLFNRLKHLFELDNDLNRSDITWRKVLQTHCVNDAQVDQLLHGVLIWYRSIPEEETETADPVAMVLDEERTAGAEQSSTEEYKKSVDYITESPFFSDSLKDELAGKTVDQQRQILIRILETELKNKPDQDLTKIEKIERKKYINELNTIIGLYTADSTVYKVLSRHPEWQNVLVVNDWTGSMYSYGGQVIQWHIINREISGIKQVTLFNDGDMKATSDKKIGSTGGIYMEKADNIERLIYLFQLVMSKGGGGDGPENDVEAILKTISKADSVSEIILIADNYACIRDISLANRIHVPVRVIVCGYKEKYGINPDLVYLANQTNGGLYTIEDDIENPKVTYDVKGNLITFKDNRFHISKRTCNGLFLPEVPVIHTSLWETRFHLKKKVRCLDLSKNELTRIPNRLYHLIYLENLDLSDNAISELGPEFGNLTLLHTLNLSHNKLVKLPDDFKRIQYLYELDLSNNQLDTLPATFCDQSFLVKLNLSGNQLGFLPRVSDLKRLEQCDLSGNQLKELPASFQSLKSLRELNLSGNQFESFPKALNRLKKLEELDFRNNSLTTIPPDILSMKKLKILHLEGNSFSVEEQERIRLQFPGTLIYF